MSSSGAAPFQLSVLNRGCLTVLGPPNYGRPRDLLPHLSLSVGYVNQPQKRAYDPDSDYLLISKKGITSGRFSTQLNIEEGI